MKKIYTTWEKVYVVICDDQTNTITILEGIVTSKKTYDKVWVKTWARNEFQLVPVQKKDVYSRKRDAMRSVMSRVRFIAYAKTTKWFKDLEHNAHPAWFGTQAVMDFKNWYSVSVIRNQYTYWGDKWLYELAIMKGDKLCYTTPITNDVLGHLTEEDVTKYMKQVQKLPE